MWNTSRSTGLYYKGSPKYYQKAKTYCFLSRLLITICYLIFIFVFQNHLIQELKKETVPGTTVGQSKLDVMKVVKYCVHHRLVRL